jgi:alpha-mannosidase
VLHDHTKRLDVRYTYDKEERRAKEAVYIAFPFVLPDARVRSDAQLGWVDWDRDELPGGCKAWLPLQTGILVLGNGADSALATSSAAAGRRRWRSPAVASSPTS